MSASTTFGAMIAGLTLGVAAASAMGCTTGAKKDVAKTALDKMPRDERLETFEATARILDERPDLVDELYANVRNHRPTMDRFFANASKDLAQRPLAEIAAKHLVENPEALEQVMSTSLDYVVRVPAARAALNRAMTSRAEEATEILTDSPQTLARVLDSALSTLEQKPQARRAALLAVRKDRKRILAFVKQDPELMKEMAEEVVREAVKDKPAVEKALRAAKVID